MERQMILLGMLMVYPTRAHKIPLDMKDSQQYIILYLYSTNSHAEWIIGLQIINIKLWKI